MPNQRNEAAPASRYLEVSHVKKDFGSFRALDDVSFDIQAGEFICFLGPSGCGKTTLLRCIAGLEPLTAGRLVQNGRDISNLPPSERDFGIVFQSYALFPNLTIEQNIGFGLVSAGRSRSEIVKRVRELTEIVGLQGQEHKYPAQLSGGQQQRAALARALAPSPGLLLLDEPLSALDAKVRTRLQREIRRVQRLLKITTIMVTHDQEEALTMADRIVVMRDGRVDQIGDANHIYREPATPFVADFIGTMNFVEGHVVSAREIRCGTKTLTVGPVAWASGTPVTCAFRPEHLEPASATGDGENLFESTVVESEMLGASIRLYLESDLGAAELKAIVNNSSAGAVPIHIGAPYHFRLRPQQIHVFARQE